MITTTTLALTIYGMIVGILGIVLGWLSRMLYQQYKDNKKIDQMLESYNPDVAKSLGAPAFLEAFEQVLNGDMYDDHIDEPYDEPFSGDIEKSARTDDNLFIQV